MWYLYIVGFSCLIFPRNLPYRTICICWVISIHQASQKDKICHKKICRHSCFPFGANANDWKQIMQEFGVLSSVALNLFSWFGILNCLNCFFMLFQASTHALSYCQNARMPCLLNVYLCDRSSWVCSKLSLSLHNLQKSFSFIFSRLLEFPAWESVSIVAFEFVFLIIWGRWNQS